VRPHCAPRQLPPPDKDEKEPGIVEEEPDESVFWIDFAADAGPTQRTLVNDFIVEGQEIPAIVVASQKTAEARRREKTGGKHA